MESPAVSPVRGLLKSMEGMVALVLEVPMVPIPMVLIPMVLIPVFQVRMVRDPMVDALLDLMVLEILTLKNRECLSWMTAASRILRFGPSSRAFW
jgi:hypothetical protein